MSTGISKAVGASGVRPLHPATRATLTTFVALVWAAAIGGNVYCSYHQAAAPEPRTADASKIAVVTRPARHGPGLVAEIVNSGEQPLSVCVRPGRLSQSAADGRMDNREYCTTLAPCSVLGVGWREGMAWEPGDEVVVEVSNSIEIRATVR